MSDTKTPLVLSHDGKGNYVIDSPDISISGDAGGNYVFVGNVTVELSDDGDMAVYAVSDDSAGVLGLIWDRTKSDVEQRTKKGVYNYTDLNRVGTAVAYLTPLFREFGFIADTSPRTDWKENEIPRRSDMERYISDIVGLNRIRYAERLLPLPSSPNYLDYIGANNLERFLAEAYLAFERMRQEMFYSGDVFSGEV